MPYVPIKQRRLEKLHKYAKQRRLVDPAPIEDNEDETATSGNRGNMSLLDQAVENKKTNPVPGTIILFFMTWPD